MISWRTNTSSSPYFRWKTTTSRLENTLRQVTTLRTAKTPGRSRVKKMETGENEKIKKTSLVTNLTILRTRSQWYVTVWEHPSAMVDRLWFKERPRHCDMMESLCSSSGSEQIYIWYQYWWGVLCLLGCLTPHLSNISWLSRVVLKYYISENCHTFCLSLTFTHSLSLSSCLTLSLSLSLSRDLHHFSIKLVFSFHGSPLPVFTDVGFDVCGIPSTKPEVLRVRLLILGYIGIFVSFSKKNLN